MTQKCNLKLRHLKNEIERKIKTKTTRRSKSKSSLLTASNVYNFALGFIGTFVDTSGFEKAVALVSDSDWCSKSSIFTNYTTAKTTYAAQIAAKVAAGEAQFYTEFGFAPASTAALLKVQMATVSTAIDTNLTEIKKTIEALTYFIDEEPNYECMLLGVIKCRDRKEWLESVYGSTIGDSLANRRTLKTAQETNQTAQLLKQSQINNDTNLVAAGDHSDMMEALYVSKTLFTGLNNCYSSYLTVLKEQFIDKMTDALIDAAAEFIADLLGVGVAELAISYAVTMVKIIIVVYKYTAASDDDKPKYLGEIIGEMVNFVLDNLGRRKMKKMKKMKKK